MTRRGWNAWLSLTLGSVFLFAMGCGGGGGSTGPTPTPTPTAATVEVSPVEEPLVPPLTVQFTAVTKDASGATIQRPMAWSSSDTKVATVSGTGLVTAVGAGAAQISATADSKSGSAAVTVLAPVTLPAAEFILVQPGTFTMGSAGAAPAHQVTLTKAFRLQRTEVTQAEWKAVTGKSPSFFSGCDQCPVEQVSWSDIQQFLKLLNAANPTANYRLPTEAEWEYACRAGTTSDYAGNGVLADMGWYNGNSQVPGGPQGTEDGRTWAVAGKLPNAWDFHDMHGNVWEWVNDWWSPNYYASSPGQDPPGPATGTTHVIRGGSWLNFPIFETSWSRAAGNELPTERYKNVGFRLARAP